jgi:hypothetical protein
VAEVLFAGDAVTSVDAAERGRQSADDVPMASKPASARTSADTPSQAFGMTKPPSRVCSAMNFS